MASNMTVLYNQPGEGEHFDLEYYINIHMPLANKHLTPLGLKSWQVIKFPAGSPFFGGVVMTWEKPDDAKKLIESPDAKPVLDDVPNFTNLKPLLLPGSIEATWELK